MADGRPRRVLSLFDCTSLIVGVIVGAGVFVAAPEVARGVGSPLGLLSLWALGGVLSLCGALGWAELATAYPEPGGEYVYLTRAYGRWAGFLFGWTQTLVVRPGDIAVMAYVAATYAEPLVGRGLGGRPLLAAAAVTAVSALNMIGVRWGVRAQNLLTVAKVVGVILVIGAGLAAHGVPSGASPPPGPPPSPVPPSVALILVLFAFGGWNEMAAIAAEVRHPRRDIVRAMLLGTAVVTALYVAVNATLLRVLGLQGLATADAAATRAVAAVMPEHAGALVSALICLCALGAVNGMVFTGARIGYAVGRDHAVLSGLGRWSGRTGTPLPALALQGGVAVAMILALGSFLDTVIFTAAAVYLFFLATGLAVMILRARDPDRPRPYRAAGYPVSSLVFCAVCALLMVSAVTYRPVMAGASLAMILGGLPVFWWSEAQKSPRQDDRCGVHTSTLEQAGANR